MKNDKLFEALSEPHRRTILDHLREQERSVGELVTISSLSQPGVSKHLRILREAGLVTVRKDAQKHMYRLNAKPLEDIQDWLTPYQQFWSNKLDDLERLLDEEE
ncbi:metalloregulator ArsR/SmtB family transcription factor [Paenibacillus sp. LHD-38]|uniref:ArsR/SmtB family transcription factor n=1 Tax=Paenibacillus sp. LHD-38 TaxID=3072143 RepID=UPI00280CD803|nr:metalloregulator ArsR/SmtB family transcription factor [Paenibacillus sp. LHD-38]MDQ8737836.1 metalloregulator ArsR/SmtB family transcription factor [Paenibacillus sp. LHD-38]